MKKKKITVNLSTIPYIMKYIFLFLFFFCLLLIPGRLIQLIEGNVDNFNLYFSPILEVGIKDNRIIIFDEFNKRIQIYSLEGEFLRGWFYHGSRKCRFFIDNYINIASSEYYYERYNLEGTLIEEREISREEYKHFSVLDNKRQSKYQYQINVPIFFTDLYIFNQDEKYHIDLPFYSRFLSFTPYPGVQYLFLFVIFKMIFPRKKKLKIDPTELY